jgi:pimeloyl-ACP methyl ester carboxylesterase
LIRSSIDLLDGTLSALRFGPATAPLRLIFCHANGFNAHAYRAVLAPLAADHQAQILALDLRGHGRTQLPTDVHALDSWNIFARDIVHVFDQVVTSPVILAGHSYGAVSAILAMADIRDRVAGYVGFDPVIVPRVFRFVSRFSAGRAYMKQRLPIARKAGQRKAVFDDPETAFARYQGRGAFKTISDAVLRDYLAGGLVATDDGRVRLACHPAWEQAIYAAQAHNLYRNIPLLPDQSRIVFAGARGRVSSDRQRQKIRRLNGDISVELERDKNHLFPLEAPTFATAVLRSVMNGPPA